jgi:hypothetical protein
MGMGTLSFRIYLTPFTGSPAFHWITGYGDYSREVDYALKKIPIEWFPMG